MKHPFRIAHCFIGRLSAFLVLVAGFSTSAWGQPYIATSQNYYCAESGDEVSMYCNVLAYDPTTDVDAWTFAWTPAD